MQYPNIYHFHKIYVPFKPDANLYIEKTKTKIIEG